MSIIRDAISIIAGLIGLRKGPKVEKLPEPSRPQGLPQCPECGWAHDRASHFEQERKQ